MKTFGHYEIVRKIGHGAMGSVYLAFDRRLDRQIALKFPKFEDLSDRDREHLVARFYREARAAAQLSSPNICTIHSFGEIEGRHYIDMAFVEGVSLAERIANHPIPTAEEIATEFHTLALALAHAHSRGVIHRDLKPSNLMIERNGAPVVLDFGLARRIDDERLTGREVQQNLTRPGVFGSPQYMSPEQLQGWPSRTKPTTDIYSLGVVLYERLTRQRPFIGPHFKVLASILSDDPPVPAMVQPAVDPHLEAICLQMMRKQPNERIQSMLDVAESLQAFLNRSTTAEGDESAPQPLRRESDRLSSLSEAEMASYLNAQVRQATELRDALDRLLNSVEEARRAGHREALLDHLNQLTRLAQGRG